MYEVLMFLKTGKTSDKDSGRGPHGLISTITSYL